MIRILIFLFAAIIASGCTNTKKETQKALLASEQSFMDKECRLNALFMDEPEFVRFEKTEFCSGKLEIIHLESISQVESIADYKITFKAKQRKLKKWLRAYEDMANRKPPSEAQQQIKAIVDKIAAEKRNWVYDKQTVKLNRTVNGWVVKDIIR